MNPNWHTVGLTTIDLNAVICVNAWHYTLNMDRPRGIRFHLKNGKSIDTEQFADEELIKLELDNIKSKLTQIIPHQ